MIYQPFGNHDKLVGARSAIAVHKEIIDGGGENEATSASNHSQKVPASETGTAEDKEDTNDKFDMDASCTYKTGLESKVTDGGDPSKNGPEVEIGPEMVSQGVGGPDDRINPSQKVKIKRLIFPKN